MIKNTLLFMEEFLLNVNISRKFNKSIGLKRSLQKENSVISYGAIQSILTLITGDLIVSDSAHTILELIKPNIYSIGTI